MNTYPSGRLADELDRRWIALTLLAWVVVAAWYVWHDWNLVRWLSLGDTDDNMRLMQVRAWLGGQGFGFWRIRSEDRGLDAVPADDTLNLPHCDLVITRQAPA